MSCSARTIRSGNIQHLVATFISPSVPSAMKLILLNITKRKCDVAWKTRKQIKQLPKKMSLVLTFLNV